MQRSVFGQIVEAQVDVLGLRLDGQHLVLQPHVHRRVLQQPLPQRPLQHRLMKAIAGVPALRADLLRAWPIDQQAAFGIDEAHAARHHQIRQQHVGEPQGLEHAHALAIEVDGARQRIDIGLTLQRQYAQPAQGQQVGQRGADGA